MRLLTVFLFCPITFAHPLWFEQRSPALFESHGGWIVRPDSLEIRGVALHFAGASTAARLEGIGPSSPATYLSANFKRTLRQFPKVAMRGVYPGIDVIVYGNGGHAEYDVVAAPGADLNRIRLRFSCDLRIDDQGDLIAGRFTQKLPRVFQSDGRPIRARYALLSPHEAAFRIGPHDARLGLTIDPELVSTNYFGGSGTDSGKAIATDAQGNIYIAGMSNSVDFPTTSGALVTPKPPMAALSNGGQTITPLPVGMETSVLGIGGSADGSSLYAFTPDATYVSSNQGSSWTQNAPLPVTATFSGTAGLMINSISVDAVDPARVFVATSRGLYTTDSGGEFWGLNDSGLPIGGNGLVNATWVAISPINHLLTYVATANPAGLFITTNAGANWTPLNPTYAGEPQFIAASMYAAALAPNGNDLYVIDPNGTLLKSTDQGMTWHPLSGQLFGAQGMLIDPTNASNVYVRDYTGIQASHDAGATFTTLLASSAINGGVQQMALDPSSGNLYFGNALAPVETIPAVGGTPAPLAIEAENLHALAEVNGVVYAGFDSPSMPYVIKFDPTGTNVLYATFFGGSRQDGVSALAVDAQGNCTVAGSALSPDFPATTSLSAPSNGVIPTGFVLRLNADGTRLIYSTLLGGSGATTAIQALALDVAGAAYVTGQTSASNFPISSAAFQTSRPQPTCTRPPTNFLMGADLGANAFLSKISGDGSQLVYSTLVTGSCGSVGEGIALDAAGEAVVVGYTTSPDFPTTQNAYQAAFPGDPTQSAPPHTFWAGFAAKISADGSSLLAGTYLGGSYTSQTNGAAVDSAGNILLTGSSGNILPGGTPGAYQPKAIDNCTPPLFIGPSLPYGGTNDAFVLKLDPTLATAAFLTYLGGSCNDSGTGIALDPAGNAWISGTSQSADFPLVSPFQGGGIANQFVSEISADGGRLLFSSGTDGIALTIDPTGQVYLVGSGASPTVAKRAQDSGAIGLSVEWSRLNPGAAPPVEIDNVEGVTGYPPAQLEPSNLGSSIVPGQLIQITGQNLGPAALVSGQVDTTGRLPFTLAGATVYFGDIPAPIESVSATRVTCFAPFEVSGTTNIMVESNGQRSNTLRWGVQTSNLQILSVINEDGTANSAAHPANPGDVLTFYVSGLGETDPLSVDGLTNAPPLPVSLMPVMVYVLGNPVQPQFVGAAPGQIAGIVQVNIQLPANGNYSSSPVNVLMNQAAAAVYVSQ